MDKYKGYLKRPEYELSSTILWSTDGYQNSTLCTILGNGCLSENFTLIKKKNNEEDRIHYIKNINMVLKYTDFSPIWTAIYMYTTTFFKKSSAVIRLRQ